MASIRPTRSIYTHSSVQFSRSVVSDSLRPHESQHTRPPCPSPTPGVHSNSRPPSRWCHPAISSSVVPFSSFPNPSQHSNSLLYRCQISATKNSNAYKANAKHKEVKIILKTTATSHKLQPLLKTVSSYSYSYLIHIKSLLSFFLPDWKYKNLKSKLKIWYPASGIL